MATRTRKKATPATVSTEGKKPHGESLLVSPHAVKVTRKAKMPSGNNANPLAEYCALLTEIDFSERGTPEELAESHLAMLKATVRMRKRANSIALD